MNRGFDPNAPLPVQVPGFTGTGNILYAGVGGTPSGAFDPDSNNIMPRFGLAYQLNDRTVIRAGAGIFYAQEWDDPGALGYSQQTDLVTGTTVGIPDVMIQNPFPAGLLQASRDQTNTLGQSFTVFNPKRPIPYVWQYSFELQRQLPWDLLFSTGGIGSSSRDIPVSQSINEISAADLALGAAYLTQQVANPFAGLAPGTSLNNPTVQRQQLLRPFPQFGSITVQGFANGDAQYWAWQSSLQKRFSAGATFTVSYTWSKLIERIDYQNPQDTVLEKQIGDSDVPHNVGINGSYELPIGAHHKFLSSSKGAVNALLGGWTVNGLVRLQSGTPTAFPANAQPVAGVNPIPENQTLDQWFMPGSFTVLPSFTLRQFTLRYSSLRNPPIHNFDLSAFKSFKIGERVTAQFRAEFINAFNSPQFYTGPETNPASANFGEIGNGVRTQTNLPRFVQFALKLNF